jgi:hypothetical protein
MKDLLLIAATSFIAIWDVTANQMTIMVTIFEWCILIKQIFTG